MKYTVALLALAASVTAQTPPGCSENFSGTFEISPVNVTGSTKRSIIEAVSRPAHPINCRTADIYYSAKRDSRRDKCAPTPQWSS